MFAFDGELTLLTRGEWGELIERGGGHVSFAVSERTTCVIGGFNCDADWDKAHRLGIATVWERDFYEQISQGRYR